MEAPPHRPRDARARVAHAHTVPTSLKLAALCALALAVFAPSRATDAAELKVGMSTALSGPASALGTGVQLGVETYFHKINAAGGVNGHTLKLIALDDGYEPKRAGPNMRALAEKGVVAVIGNVGTPTAIVTVPVANELKVPLIGAFTGAGVLRKQPPERYIINYRASYAEETGAMIRGLLDAGIKPDEIAFFTQDDGYGDAGYNGAVKALTELGYDQASTLQHGRYERNTLNVEDGLITVLSGAKDPRAVIMVGAYGPCAEFIRLAKEDLPDAYFLNVSFVGSKPLKAALRDDADRVIVTQVVPHFGDDLAGVSQYRTDLKAYAPDAEPGFVSLEGYLAARIFVTGLTRVNGRVTRDAIVDAIENIGDLDVGIGVPISYSAADHQGSHQVWPTIIRNNRFEPLDWSRLQ